jgi:hypothetical protein
MAEGRQGVEFLEQKGSAILLSSWVDVAGVVEFAKGDAPHSGEDVQPWIVVGVHLFLRQEDGDERQSVAVLGKAPPAEVTSRWQEVLARHLKPQPRPMSGSPGLASVAYTRLSIGI